MKCANPSCASPAQPGYDVCSPRCRNALKSQRIRESRRKQGLCPQCGGEMIPAPSYHKSKEFANHCVKCQIYYRDRYEIRTYGRKLTEHERMERERLINATQVAEILGVELPRITYLASKLRSGSGHLDFPAPVYFLSEKRPLWNISEIEAYRDKHK
jgi:predicted DNA-binding transcriptional regulator AlpA